MCSGVLGRALATVFIWAFFSSGTLNAAEQYVIIDVDPELAPLLPGKEFSVGDEITIPAGTTLFLLGEDGSVSEIAGPVTISITVDAPGSGNSENEVVKESVSTLSRIGEILSGSRVADSAFGGTRSVGLATADPWVIPVDSSSNGCIRDDVVALSRKNSSEQSIISVQFSNKLAEYQFKWVRGQSVARLPLGFAEGGTIVSLSVTGIQKSIPLNYLPRSIDRQNDLKVIEWMMDSGCLDQGVALVQQLRSKAQKLN